MDAAPGRSGAQVTENAQLRAALDAVPVPVLSVSADGAVSFVNRSLATWLGHPARAARTQPLDLLVGTQAAQSVRDTLRTPNRGAVTVQLSIPGADAVPRRVEVTIDPHGPPGTMPSGATVSFLKVGDVSPESADEAASELRAMLDAVTPAVALVDCGWSLLRWNPAFAALGLVPRERVQEDLDLTAIVSRLHLHRLGPRPEGVTLPDVPSAPGGRIEFRAELPTGQRIDVELTAQADGKIVIMLHDVTDTSVVQEELRRSERLRTIGQLTGGVAHDFNNLLSVIVGNLDLLDDQGLFGEQRTLVEAAKRSALRGASLTGSLLTYQRRAAGHPEPTSATAMVENLERVLRRTLGGQVAIETRLTSSPWLTLVDPGLLENAVVNLALNARDAMPDGGTLTIATEIVPGGLKSDDGCEARDAVIVSVRDTGVGMNDSTRARATEAFFTTKTEGRGTGLGLAMVRRFVAAADGRIVIHSRELEGTEVRLVLPRHMGQASAEKTEEPVAPLQGRGKHVLLVEDNAHVRSTFRGMLRRLGYRVTDVEHPQAALELMELDGDAFDVLLTDARFPNGPSGIEIARKLAQAHPSLDLLLMSGHPDTERPFGIPVLSKPCTLSALSSVLATLDT